MVALRQSANHSAHRGEARPFRDAVGHDPVERPDAVGGDDGERVARS